MPGFYFQWELRLNGQLTKAGISTQVPIAFDPLHIEALVFNRTMSEMEILRESRTFALKEERDSNSNSTSNLGKETTRSPLGVGFREIVRRDSC